MYSPFKLATKYFKYKWQASNAKGHGVHSPFVYNLIREVLMDQRNFYAYDAIEFCKDEMLKDYRVLHIDDFVAGSRSKKTSQKSISDIANSSLMPKKYSQLIFRLVNYYAPKNMLELGTSLGITTSYLAAANENAEVYTMEVASEIAAIAQSNFEKLGLNNISTVIGNFDETLPAFLERDSSLDFVFVNGNHSQKSTMRYFKQLLLKVHENSILIFEDIHVSAEMEVAWKEIQEHPLVMLTVDLFFIGLVFFRKETKVKQHFLINF